MGVRSTGVAAGVVVSVGLVAGKVGLEGWVYHNEHAISRKTTDTASPFFARTLHAFVGAMFRDGGEVPAWMARRLHFRAAIKGGGIQRTVALGPRRGSVRELEGEPPCCELGKEKWSASGTEQMPTALVLARPTRVGRGAQGEFAKITR